jgi:hypothetical protein
MRLGAAIKIAKEILDQEGGEERRFHSPNLSQTSTTQKLASVQFSPRALPPRD